MARAVNTPDNPGTDFGPYFLVSSLESEIFGIITKVCVFCDTCHLCKQLTMNCSCGAYIVQSQQIFFQK